MGSTPIFIDGKFVLIVLMILKLNYLQFKIDNMKLKLIDENYEL